MFAWRNGYVEKLLYGSYIGHAHFLVSGLHFQTVTNCHGLKMTAPDGKMRLTDVADVEQLFRLVQSIPSPKAEPFKLWLSSLARERLEEIDDPEQGIDRMLEYYHRKGYSENWINQRLKSIEVRKELTDEWERRVVKKAGNMPF